MLEFPSTEVTQGLSVVLVLASLKSCFLETGETTLADDRLANDDVIEEVHLQNLCTACHSLVELRVRLGRARAV